MPDSELTNLPPMTMDRELTDEDLMYVVDVDDPANTSKQISAARLAWSADGQPVRIYGGPVDLHLAGTTYLPAISEGTALVDTESQQTVSNKTLNQATINSPTIVTPTISATGWGAANHNHSSANRGGTIDHGALTGRSDDDHTQYHTDERADALYYRKGAVWTRTEANNRFAELSHTHNYAAASHSHDSRYYTETQMQTSGQAQLHWNNVTNKPSTYAPSSHSHSYASTSHTHDSRYYTESQMQTSGQASVHWNNITNAPAIIGGASQILLGSGSRTKGQVNNLNIPACNAIIFCGWGIANLGGSQYRPYNFAWAWDGDVPMANAPAVYVPHEYTYGEYQIALEFDWDPGRTYELQVVSREAMAQVDWWAILLS
jgi:hypothetical protein